MIYILYFVRGYYISQDTLSKLDEEYLWFLVLYICLFKRDTSVRVMNEHLVFAHHLCFLDSYILIFRLNE